MTENDETSPDRPGAGADGGPAAESSTPRYRFDPMTGQPLDDSVRDVPQARFDPVTGQPLTPPPPGSAEDPSAPRPPKSPKRTRVLILAAVVLILGVVGAGIAAATLIGPSAEEEAEAALKSDQQSCREAAGDYFDALDDLDSRLDVGLTQSVYSSLVGDIAVERNSVDEAAANDLDFCASALEAADAVAFAYSFDAQAWNNCIFKDGCDPDTDLDLSSGWTLNSDALAAMRTAIEDGEPIDPDSEVGERVALIGEANDILDGA